MMKTRYFDGKKDVVGMPFDQEKIENFDSRKLNAMLARIPEMSIWDQHSETLDSMCRVIENEMNFRACQDAADTRFHEYECGVA